MMFSGHRVLVVTVLTLLLGQLRHVHSWVNLYDQPFTFSCENGQFLSYVASQHDNYREDRRFDFSCKALPVKKGVISCGWTHEVNDWDQPKVYQCYNDGFVAGISSYHENEREDRRFKFYCCRSPELYTHDCTYTGWLNEYDKEFKYTVPNGRIMKGMISFHSNYHEDRRFQLQICELKISC